MPRCELFEAQDADTSLSQSPESHRPHDPQADDGNLCVVPRLRYVVSL
jgi:hypothetical protein